MAEERNVKDKTNEGKISKHMKDFLVKLRGKVVNDDTDRENWKLKMIIATNQRLGVKRASDFPYPDAPDIPLPETDKLIKKATPNLVLSAWSPKNMAKVALKDGFQMTPEIKIKIQKSESVLNMYLRSRELNMFQKLSLAADFAKQYGFALFRTIETFKSVIRHKMIDLDDLPEGVEDELKSLTKDELRQFVADRFDLDPENEDDKEAIDEAVSQFKSGERVIEFDYEEVKSFPDVEVPVPTKVIVPSYTTDIEQSERITYEYFLPRHTLEQKMRDGSFRKKDLDDIDLSGVSKNDNDDMVETQKGYNEGVMSGQASDLFRIHETLTWYADKPKSRLKRWAFTTLADVYDPEEALLQDIQFPYEFTHDAWNYDKFDNEIKDPRYHNSRGLPEQIRAIQEIMERSINNMIIRDEMNNTPMWEVLDTSDILDAHLHFTPGEKLPVKQVGQEIKRLNEPSTVDVSSDRIMQILKASAEEYVGSTDQLFRNATNAGGGKTLGEIREGVKQTSGILNLDVINWNNTLTSVYQKMFDILKDRLDESIFIEGLGEVTREDFNFPAEVRSNGTLEVADKDLATVKAQNRLMLIAQFMQAGVVDQEDIYNALQDWLEKDGVKDPDQFSTDPKVILQTKLAQMNQMLQQMQQQAGMMNEQITKGNKEVARIDKRGKEVVSKTEGQLEALVG